MAGEDAAHGEKQRLRTAVLRMLDQVDEEVMAAASNRASDRLLSIRAMQRAQTVALYRAVGHELDPAPAMTRMAQRGIRTLLPRVVDDRIHLAPSSDPGLLVAGRGGIPEPAGGSVPLDEVDVVVLPGVAFDLDGGRLGRGGGHYDRLLEGLAFATVRIGLAHTAQLVTRVPREDHDQPLDMLITDRGIHITGARDAPRDA